MNKDVEAKGMSLGPGVIETIISIAVSEVEGVASVGPYSTSGLRSLLGQKPSTSGIEVEENDDGRLAITVHVEVYHGYPLPKLAAEVRKAVADALSIQVGIEVASVDIYVDGIQFAA